MPEAFIAGPMTVLDPTVGGLELGNAVVGGVGTAAIVAMMLGAPVGRWAHLAAIPLLAAIVAGKLTMVLGGSGQGRPFDGDWATAYLGAGPWVSLAPAVPSHPSQVYEAIGTAIVALLILIASSLGLFRPATGAACWSRSRAGVSPSGRRVLAGPRGRRLAPGRRVDRAWDRVAIIGIASCRRGPPRGADRAAAAEPAWPEPETRPPF